MILSWADVLARHGSRRGIRVTPGGASILFDVGLSPYANRREGRRLHYQGEGRAGDQMPTGGNAGLLECLETGRPITVFERLGPGRWLERGSHRVVSVSYRRFEAEDRMAFEFVLEPVE